MNFSEVKLQISLLFIDMPLDMDFKPLADRVYEFNHPDSIKSSMYNQRLFEILGEAEAFLSVEHLEMVFEYLDQLSNVGLPAESFLDSNKDIRDPKNKEG